MEPDVSKQTPEEHGHISAPQIVTSKKRFSLSKQGKQALLGLSMALIIIAGFGSYALYRNVNIDAATCVNNTYKYRSSSSCVKYAEQMLNGISTHYGIIPSPEGIKITTTQLNTDYYLGSSTRDKVTLLQNYLKIPVTNIVDKTTWYYICSLANNSYQSYSSNVLPSTVKTGWSAYASASCASATPPLTITAAVTEPASQPNVSPEETQTLTPATTTDTPEATSPSATTNATVTLESETPTTELPTTSTFDITTWNIQGGDPDNFSSTQTLAGLTTLSSSLEVLGLQESHIASFRKTIRDKIVCTTCAYDSVMLTKLPSGTDAYSSSGSMPASLPIMWKRGMFRLENYGVYTVLASNFTDEAGNSVSRKWITWVMLNDLKTGKSFYVLNTHTVATIESLGLPSKLTSRNKNYQDHMDMLVSKITSFQKNVLPIFLVGDLNVNYRYDSVVQYPGFPYAKLGAIGMESNWHMFGIDSLAPTTGSYAGSSRLIDYVLSWKHDSVGYNSTTISPSGYGSDHYPVSLNVTVTK